MDHIPPGPAARADLSLLLLILGIMRMNFLRLLIWEPTIVA